MYYSLKKSKSKALIVCLLSAVIVCFSTVCVYAYDRVYVYTSADFGMETSLFSGTVLAKLSSIKHTYVLDTSPRNTGYSKSVTIDYSSLSDLVYYCNEHGLNATLTYNTAVGKYLAFVQDYEFSIGSFSNIKVVGCLGNSDGSVYLADKSSSGGSTEVSVDTSGIIQMLQTIQSAIAGLDNTLANILNANDEGFTMLGALTGWTNSYIVAYGDKISAQCSSISTSLADLEIKMNSLMTYIPSMSTDIYSISNAVNSIDTNVIT